MATQFDNSMVSMKAGEALSAWRRVKLDSTNDQQVVYADAGEDAIGVTQHAAANTEKVQIKLLSGEGTYKCTASAAISTRNAKVYGAADGKVSTTASGDGFGLALDTATANGSIVEVLLLAQVETGIGDVAKIDDNLGGTTGGTDQYAATYVTIDDDLGGTTGGTEQYAATAVAIDDDTGGTTGGTEQLNVVPGTGYSAGVVTVLNNNYAVLSASINALITDLANVGAVTKNALDTLDTDIANLGAVTKKKLDDIIDAG